MSSNHSIPKGAVPGTVAHAEAALGAGRTYERPHEGHNKLYDNYTDLVEDNNYLSYGKSNEESRGRRIDRELAEEDKEELQRKDQARQQKEKDNIL